MSVIVAHNMTLISNAQNADNCHPDRLVANAIRSDAVDADKPHASIADPSKAVRRPHKNASKLTGRWCQHASFHVSDKLSEFFYKLGYAVATHPWRTIVSSWMLMSICCIGLMFFNIEKDPMKLWIPQDSRYILDTEWIMQTFQTGYREQSILITAPDVLRPEVLHQIALISNDVTRIRAQSNNGTTLLLNDVCVKIPFIAHLLPQPKASENLSFFGSLFKSSHPYNPSVDLDPSLYCSIINTLPFGCMTNNMLDLWQSDADRIRQLERDEILDALHRTSVNPVSGHNADFVPLLGDVRRNSSGHIVGAGAILVRWMLFVNYTATDHQKIGNLAGTEYWASEEALAWESAFIGHMERLTSDAEHKNNNNTADLIVTYSAGRSYGDISAADMFRDLDRVIIGGCLMFVYMQLVLSRFGWTEIRLMFSGIGLLSVGMSFVAAIGVCSAFGVPYGPVHTSLPFLLMGLGVDDMFVLMSCWRHVESSRRGHGGAERSLADRVGTTMRHAGSSITVTSITDVVAFLIGAWTILPSLESFCIYAAVGVSFMYLLVITFVVAILTLDERRIAANRNSFMPCYVHRRPTIDATTTPKLWLELNLMHRFLRFLYTRIILTTTGKIAVVLTACALSAYSVQGLLRLEQRFDPNWFIPEHTYLRQYLRTQEQYYPDAGQDAFIFVGAIDYALEMPKLLHTVEAFENRTELVKDVDAWLRPFGDFVRVYYEHDIRTQMLSDAEWRDYLSKFLFSADGGRFQAVFRFDRPLVCGQPTGNVTVTSIPFRYRRFVERSEYVWAMHEMERIVDGMRLESGDAAAVAATVWAKIYGNWIVDEVVDTEVLRNVMLALVCVMACTLVLIAEPRTCLYIFVCVLLTLVNVCGFMQRWGLTVDVVSCIGLELAVGLCVDYASHVGHTFLTLRSGTKNERALETILQIGAAVLYGGGSTFLAILVLANSEAYTFKAFFKIFVLVIVFGLFHGVVLLPVVLSWIGPDPLPGGNNEKRDDMGSENGHKRNGKKCMYGGAEMDLFIPKSTIVPKGDNSGCVPQAESNAIGFK